MTTAIRILATVSIGILAFILCAFIISHFTQDGYLVSALSGYVEGCVTVAMGVYFFTEEEEETNP